MLPGHLSVFAEFYAKHEHIDTLRTELLALVVPTRAEEGCLQYDLHEDQDRPGHFFFYENWTGREALDRHGESAHIQRLRSLVGDLVESEVRVMLFDRIA